MNAGSKSRAALSAAFSHCVNQVRSYDYHHYLCLLELPSPATRRAAFAIRAFNVEVAKAMDVASDPQIGLMRLLWWRDALDKIFSSSKPIDHPVAIALSASVASGNLKTATAKAWLRRSVEARIDDANRGPNEIPRRIDDLEKYGEKTASGLLYATLQSAGISSAAADHAASHIGKASSLLLLLRSIPYHASRSRERFYIPLEVAEKHGLGLGLGPSLNDRRENLSDAVFEMASVAGDHLRRARDLAPTIPAEARPVFLPAVAAQAALDGLRKANFDVFDPRLNSGVLGSPPLWFHLKLKWHSLRGKY